MDMDKEIESIDNQSEEAAVAAAAAAASIMMGLIEQEAEDEDCAGANGEEEEEEEQEPKAKQRRRSYPRPTVSTWNRRGDSGYGSSKSCILRKVGLTRIAGRHGSSSLLFESLPDVPRHRRGRGACISSCSCLLYTSPSPRDS